MTYYADGLDDLVDGATLVGDLDGDGYDDLAIGVPGIDSNDGAVHVFSGPFHSGDSFWSGLPEDAIVTSDAGSRAGTSVVAAGDIDGDGNDDVVVGAARANTSTALAVGAAYVLSGPVSAGDGIDQHSGRGRVRQRGRPAVSTRRRWRAISTRTESPTWSCRFHGCRARACPRPGSCRSTRARSPARKRLRPPT